MEIYCNIDLPFITLVFPPLQHPLLDADLIVSTLPERLATCSVEGRRRFVVIHQADSRATVRSGMAVEPFCFQVALFAHRELSFANVTFIWREIELLLQPLQASR